MSEAIIILYILFLILLFVLFYMKNFKLLIFKINVKSVHTNDVWSIPGPKSLPFFGTKWIYFWKYKLSKMHDVYTDFNKKYGGIVLEVTTGGIPIVNLFEKNDIELVLKNSGKYPFRPPTEIVACYRRSRPDRYASTGITNEQGEKWYHLRSKITPHITSTKTLDGFLPELNTICDDFINLLRIHRKENGKVYNFQEISNLLGLEAICTLLLGRRMGFLAEFPPIHVQKLAKSVKNHFITQRDSYHGLGLWKYFATKTYRDFVKSEETIYNIISEIVDEAFENDQMEFTDGDMRSVFLSILSERDLDIRDKKSAIIDLIAAGIETLANTLTFVLYYTSLEPDTQIKIAKEFNHDQKILRDDLNGAKFTKACLQEAYRLNPTAFCLARLLEQDIRLSGYDLKAGTFVLCQTMICCRNDKNFKQANIFDPNRWFDALNLTPRMVNGNGHSESCSSPSTTVVPFGYGRRTCPGRRFVEMELLLILAKLIRAFHIEFEDGLETEFEFLLVPKIVSITFKDRIC